MWTLSNKYNILCWIQILKEIFSPLLILLSYSTRVPRCIHPHVWLIFHKCLTVKTTSEYLVSLCGFSTATLCVISLVLPSLRLVHLTPSGVSCPYEVCSHPPPSSHLLTSNGKTSGLWLSLPQSRATFHWWQENNVGNTDVTNECEHFSLHSFIEQRSLVFSNWEAVQSLGYTNLFMWYFIKYLMDIHKGCKVSDSEAFWLFDLS